MHRKTFISLWAADNLVNTLQEIINEIVKLEKQLIVEIEKKEEKF